MCVRTRTLNLTGSSEVKPVQESYVPVSTLSGVLDQRLFSELLGQSDNNEQEFIRI